MAWLSKILGKSKKEEETPSNSPREQSSALAEGNEQKSAPESKPDAEPAPSGEEPIVSFLVSELTKIAASRGDGVLSAADYDIEVDLYASGYIDSMQVTTLLLAAEAEYGVKLPDYIVGDNANTIRALADHIRGLLP